MLGNIKQQVYEGFRVSTELRQKIQERWGIIYGATDELQQSLNREFGTAELRHPAEPAPSRPVDVAHLANNVMHLEARRDQQVLREQTAQDRQVVQARNMVEGAFDEFAA